MGNLLPDPLILNALQTSALFVKGKANIPGGRDHYFHLQITASGLSNIGTESEAELYQKIPDIDNLNRLRQATDTHVVITLRGIGEMTPNNPESRVELATTPSDSEYGRPMAYVVLGDADAPTAQSSQQTQDDAVVWEAMDAFTDQVALIFANGTAFEILTRNGARSIRVPAGAAANDLAQLHPHGARRDFLGSTHHEAGTLRMSAAANDGVTNEYGRIHDTTNCYVVGPALLPMSGSPNPMLTGVALARRTAQLLTNFVLPRPDAWAANAPYIALFDGTEQSFRRWTRVSPDGSNGFALINGEIVTYGSGDFGLLYYADRSFADFTLKVQFRIFDSNNHNSGIFVRFRDPLLDPPQVIRDRMIQESNNEKVFRPDRFSDIELFNGDPNANPPRNPNRAWSAVYSGFEIQIDDTAGGDPRKPFYGSPEPVGLRKNRTGAIYKIPAADPIPSGGADAADQNYQPAPALNPYTWYEFTIDVRGNNYTVELTNLTTGVVTQTTAFQNGDGARGVAQENGVPVGYIGLQSYPGAQVAFRRIQILE